MVHRNTFNREMDEKRFQYEERTAEMKRDWERETTLCLLSEVKSRLQGCSIPYCLACGNTDALVDVLKERFDTDILDKVLGGD